MQYNLIRRNSGKLPTRKRGGGIINPKLEWARTNNLFGETKRIALRFLKYSEASIFHNELTINFPLSPFVEEKTETWCKKKKKLNISKEERSKFQISRQRGKKWKFAKNWIRWKTKEKEREKERERGNKITDLRYFRGALWGSIVTIGSRFTNLERTRNRHLARGKKFDLSDQTSAQTPVEEKWNVGQAVVSNLSSNDILHSLWK